MMLVSKVRHAGSHLHGRQVAIMHRDGRLCMRLWPIQGRRCNAWCSEPLDSNVDLYVTRVVFPQQKEIKINIPGSVKKTLVTCQTLGVAFAMTFLLLLWGLVAGTLAAGNPALQGASLPPGTSQTVPAAAVARNLAQGTSAFPDYVDWGERGMLTAPKNLKGCGASWAFAAVTAVESRLAIDHGKLFNLSAQQLVDCVDAAHGYPDNDGCYSGYVEDALSYVQSHELATEAAYGRYAAQKLACKDGLLRSLPASQLVRLSASPGYRKITPNSATALMQAVSQQPVVVIMWVPNSIMVGKGIFNSPCPTAPADSDMTMDQYESQYGPGANRDALVVGYNAKGGAGTPGTYWIVDLFWGDRYSLKFEMLPDGTSGKCGMYTYPVAPLSTVG